MTSYLVTPAAMKLIVEEPESAALETALTASDDDDASEGSPHRRLVASWLLHTELHCAAGRHPNAVALGSVQTVLDTVDLVDLTRGDLLAAGTHVPLRSNDAIHLATALRLGVDEMITYDAELTEAAARAGLAVYDPS